MPDVLIGISDRINLTHLGSSENVGKKTESHHHVPYGYGAFFSCSDSIDTSFRLFDLGSQTVSVKHLELIQVCICTV
jgi:hypothetical protein